jgi:uncharacterized protein
MSAGRVFVDAWAWIALAAVRDQGHPAAVAVSRRLRSEGRRLITSNFVVGESLTRLRLDAGLPAALVPWDALAALVLAGELDVVVVDEGLFAEALDWFRRFDDQLFSLTDCTSFAIMNRLGLSEAFTADRHFASAGFVPLAAAP